jgi:hypothetical protein
MTIVVTQAELASYGLVAILGFIILRRAYIVTHGAAVSIGRLVVLPIFYVLIYAGEIAAIGYGAVGSGVADSVYGSIVADGVFVVIGAYIAYGYARRHVELFRPDETSVWYYRLGPIVSVIYVVLFFARTAIELVVLNLQPFGVTSAAALAAASPFALYSLFVVDALWGLSTGFLLGRNAAVYHEWQQKQTQPGASPGTALP